MKPFFDSASPGNPQQRLNPRIRPNQKWLPMRLFRLGSVPFLALVAAAALVLLTPSPAPAEITEGRLSVGSGGSTLIIAVFADTSDAQNGVPSGVASSGSITAGDAAYISNGANPRNTFANRSLHVSNQTAAYDAVLITATVTGVDDGACAEATVTNERSGESVAVLLAPTSEALIDGARTYQGVMTVAGWDAGNANGPNCGNYTAGTNALAALRARDGDNLSVAVEGVSSAIKLSVDGEGPVFRVFSPQPGSNLPSAVVNFSFDVRDDGAGLRHDGEFAASGNGDSQPVNVDGDQFTSNEPRSTADGGAADIHASFSRAGGDATDVTSYGTSLWKVIETGTAYDLSVDVNVGGSGSFDLKFEATDRAGNTTTENAADVAVVLPTATPTPPPGSTPTPSRSGEGPTATPTPMPGTVTPTPTPGQAFPTPTPTPMPGTGGSTPEPSHDNVPTATPTPMPGSGGPTPQPSTDDGPTATPTPMPGSGGPTPQPSTDNVPTATPTPRPGEGASGEQSPTAHLPTATPTPRPGGETPSAQPPGSNVPTPTPTPRPGDTSPQSPGGNVPTPTPTPSTPPDPQAWLEAWIRAWQAWLALLLAGFFQ